MDFVRSPAPTRAPLRLVRSPVSNPEGLKDPPVALMRGGMRRAKAGPLPSLPARDLERKISIEDAFPILLLLGFAALAGIQALLLT